MHTPRRLRRAIVLIPAVLALAVSASPVAGASPAGTDPTDSGWLVVRDPLGASTPAAMDRGNSTGGEVTWSREGVGQVFVIIEGIDDAGVPQVSALSTAPRSCYVSGWGGSSVGMTILCTDRSGARRDTPFSLVYTRGTGGSGGVPGRLAHAWVDADTPTSFYNHVTDGGSITRTQVGPGEYLVTVPGLGTIGGKGTVQVTRYGDEGSCGVISWAPAGADLQARVRCRTLDGSLSDSSFNFLYLRRLGPEGFGGGPSAYLWASRKNATAGYRPERWYSWQSNGKRPLITRTAVGVYRVRLTEMPKGGAAVVTAHGGGTQRCQLGSIAKTAPATVTVRCFKPNGAPINSNFTLAWTK